MKIKEGNLPKARDECSIVSYLTLASSKAYIHSMKLQRRSNNVFILGAKNIIINEMLS